MASFEIGLEWGGKWNGGERKCVRPIVQAAADIAAQASDEAGFVPTQPKGVKLWKSASTYDVEAETDSATKIDINIPIRRVKHRKVAPFIANLSLTTYHELTHCFRMEFHNGADIVEFAATEGIAHVAEDMLGFELIGKDEYDGHRFGMPPMSDRALARQTELMYADADLQLPLIDDPSFLDPFHEKWFKTPVEGTDYPMGVILGTHHVLRRLEQGAGVSELVSWPPHEIIRL